MFDNDRALYRLYYEVRFINVSLIKLNHNYTGIIPAFNKAFFYIQLVLNQKSPAEAGRSLRLAF